MRFLVIGLGSMGKRRIRCLRRLEAGDVIGFDPREDRRAEVEGKYGVRTFSGFDAAMAEGPEALVISTPPDLHTEYAHRAAEAGRHFFVEASVTDDGMDVVERLVAERAIVAAPSCTLRHHPSIKLIKQIVDEGGVGKVLAFTYHSGQHLADWHPWEDYRSFYVSKRETGACREIVPFELCWLTWVLGEIDTLSCMRAKVSGLDADIDDVYQLLIRFAPGTIGHLLVDVLSRAPTRHLRLVGSRGVVEWDAGARTVRLYDPEVGDWQTYPEPEAVVESGYSHMSAEGMYVDEMRTFLDAVAGRAPYPYTLDEDRRILRLLYAAEQSSDSSRHVTLE